MIVRKLTKFGQFLVDIFDNEARMSPQEAGELNIKLFCEHGITLHQLDKMSMTDINKIGRNKRFQNKYLKRK